MTTPNSYASVYHLDRQVHGPTASPGNTGGVVITPTDMRHFGAFYQALGGAGAINDHGESGVGLPQVGYRVHQLVDDYWNATSDIICVFENSGGVWYLNHMYYSLTSAGVVTFATFNYNIGAFETLFVITLTDLPAANTGTFLTAFIDYDSASGTYRWGLYGDDGTVYGLAAGNPGGRYIGADPAQGYGPNSDPANTRFDIGAGVFSTAWPEQHIDGAECVPSTFANPAAIPMEVLAGRIFLYDYDSDTLAEIAGGPSQTMFNGDAGQLMPTFQPGGTWLNGSNIPAVGPVVSVIYNAPTTTWTIPYNVSTDQTTDGHLTIARLDTFVWLEDPKQAINNGVVVTRPATNQIAVTGLGDMSSVPVLIGVLYDMYWEQSTIYERNQKGGSEVRGRLNLRNISYSLGPMTDMTVTVTPQGRDPYDYVFYDPTAQQGDDPGDSEFYPFRVPLQMRNEDATIVVTNGTPGSTRIVMVDWEGQLVLRTRAV